MLDIQNVGQAEVQHSLQRESKIISCSPKLILNRDIRYHIKIISRCIRYSKIHFQANIREFYQIINW